MELMSAVGLLLTIVPAVSYGWGMRGTTIGGEKGAMLPGALIGLILALFSDVLIVRENFYIFSALGAVAMYFGGAMTYGETLGLSMNSKPAENMKKGLIALFIKGFLWFGSFGAIFTSGISSVCGIYSFMEMLVLFIATPLFAILGYFVFNKPHKPQENKFPKIYFSKTRQESWGALVGLLLPIIILSIVKGNLFTIIFTFCCALFGGIGWVLGQLLQIYSIHYAENSTSAFGRYISSKNHTDSWKIMECVLGAFGGLGAAVGLILTHNDFIKITFNLEKNGGLIPVNNTFSDIAFIIWIVLLLIDLLHYFIKKPITKAELEKNLKAGKISRGEYSVALIKARDEVPRFYDLYFKCTEKLEPVLYGAIPFVLICLGCKKTALIASFFLIFLVLCQEITLEKEITPKYGIIPKIAAGIICLLVFILQFTTPLFTEYKAHLILYTIVYELLTLAWLVPEIIINYRKKHTDSDAESAIISNVEIIKQSKAFLKVHGYFIFCIVITLILIL